MRLSITRICALQCNTRICDALQIQRGAGLLKGEPRAGKHVAIMLKQSGSEHAFSLGAQVAQPHASGVAPHIIPRQALEVCLKVAGALLRLLA